MEYENLVLASEEAIRNTNEKQYYNYDSFNIKTSDELFRIIANSCNNRKAFSLVYWLIKSMDKNNFVTIPNHRILMNKMNVNKNTYYKLLNTFSREDLLVKLSTTKFMVNPEVVINYRKSLTKDRPELLALWSTYKELAKGEIND